MFGIKKMELRVGMAVGLRMGWEIRMRIGLGTGMGMGWP